MGGWAVEGLVLAETCGIKTGFVPSEQEAFYSSDMSPSCSRGRTTYHHTVISLSLFLPRNPLATLENTMLQSEVFDFFLCQAAVNAIAEFEKSTFLSSTSNGNYVAD